MGRRQIRTLALLLFLGGVLGGCVSKLPQTVPLDASQTKQAQRLLAKATSQPKATSVDADVRVTWDMLGSKGGIDGIVQLQRPALLRFSLLDPLARSLMVVVSDGRYFALADNRKGLFYQGATDSRFWQRYVPASIHSEELLAYLGGQFPDSLQDPQCAGDEEGKGIWYMGQSADRQRFFRILLDQESARLRRLILLDAEQTSVLDISYSGTAAEVTPAPFIWPQRLDITGEAISGTLVVHFQNVQSYAPLSPSTFELVRPPQFVIEKVE